MAAARRNSGDRVNEVFELSRRARSAAELAQLTLNPPEPLLNGPAYVLAANFYRQAIFWLLLARRRMAGIAASNDEAASVWAAADGAALAQEAGHAELAPVVERAIRTPSFVEFAEVEADLQEPLARGLRLVVDPLLDRLDRTRTEIERVWLRRMVRTGTLVVVLGALLATLVLTADMQERARDLAPGKPWTASSRYPDGGCESPSQKCDTSPNYFVATNEEKEPWLIFDLNKPEMVSGTRIVNRPDCCPGRGLPLIVELSDDKRTWREVARRTTDFSSWRASFTKSRARYVRIRSPAKTLINLQQVRILP